jgi:putative FmdB family regulatory protein
MPIYEYHCQSCGHEFEAMQKITDEPIRKCESCGKMKAKRSISRTSFVLKGSGWYVTDYGGANASNRPPTASSSSDGKKEKETPKKAVNE